MATTYTQPGASGNPFGDYFQFVSNALQPRTNPAFASNSSWLDDGLGFVGDASNGFGLTGDNAPPAMSLNIAGNGTATDDSFAGTSGTASTGGSSPGGSAFDWLTPADWGGASTGPTVPQNSDQLGAQNYQGQQAAAASLASAFPNPFYQLGNPPVAGGQSTGLPVSEMSQWNPTVGDDVRQVWNDIRTSQPVEAIFGRTPDETVQMLEPRPTGLLPNTAKALQDWQVVGAYSPADLLPAPQTVGQGITTAVLRQVNLNNVLMATGGGEVLKMLSLAQDAPRAVALTKAFLRAYGLSQGAQVVGQSAGDIAGNPNLPPGQKGADLGNIGLGILNIKGS